MFRVADNRGRLLFGSFILAKQNKGSRRAAKGGKTILNYYWRDIHTSRCPANTMQSPLAIAPDQSCKLCLGQPRIETMRDDKKSMHTR